MTTTTWTTYRDFDGKAYAYLHTPSGIRLCDIKRRQVTGYDDYVYGEKP